MGTVSLSYHVRRNREYLAIPDGVADLYSQAIG